MKMITVVMTFVVLTALFFFSPASAKERQKVNILLRVPFFHQIRDLNEDSTKFAEKTACGPTALAIMLRYSGLDVDVNDVLKLIPIEAYIPKVGFVDLSAGASVFNREAVKVKFSHQDIYEALDQGHPVFLNLFNYDNVFGHGVVIVGMKGYDGSKAESLIIHDVWTKGYQEFKFNTYDTLVEPGNGNINIINKSNLFYVK